MPATGPDFNLAGQSRDLDASKAFSSTVPSARPFAGRTTTTRSSSRRSRSHLLSATRSRSLISLRGSPRIGAAILAPRPQTSSHHMPSRGRRSHHRLRPIDGPFVDIHLRRPDGYQVTLHTAPDGRPPERSTDPRRPRCALGSCVTLPSALLTWRRSAG